MNLHIATYEPPEPHALWKARDDLQLAHALTVECRVRAGVAASVGCVHPAGEPDMARFGAPRMALSVSHDAPQRGQGPAPRRQRLEAFEAFDVRPQEPS